MCALLSNSTRPVWTQLFMGLDCERVSSGALQQPTSSPGGRAMKANLIGRLWERGSALSDLGEIAESVRVPGDMLNIDGALHIEAAGRMEGYEAMITKLEGDVLDQHGHFLNFAKSIGAKDGDDMLELLYGFFARIRCECGHPADEHHEETGCGHPDPIHGYCECKKLEICLWSTSGRPERTTK